VAELQANELFPPFAGGFEGRAGQRWAQLLCCQALRWGNAIWGLTPEMLQKGWWREMPTPSASRGGPGFGGFKT